MQIFRFAKSRFDGVEYVWVRIRFKVCHSKNEIPNEDSKGTTWPPGGHDSHGGLMTFCRIDNGKNMGEFLLFIMALMPFKI